jgi:CheY-like chemotaxis protein
MRRRLNFAEWSMKGHVMFAISHSEQRSRLPVVPRSTRKRVLVVDDDHLMRTVTEQVLKRSGYDSILMEDGDFSDHAISRLQFDAALIDLGLPGISGQEFIGKLRALSKSPDAPIFVATASTDIETMRDCYTRLSVQLVISKPIWWTGFIDKLKHELWFCEQQASAFVARKALGADTRKREDHGRWRKRVGVEPTGDV